MKRALLALLLGTVVLSACTVGPDYVEPEARTNENWLSEDAPQISNSWPDDLAWWRIFNDPVLDELVSLARRQNLSLRVAGLRVLQAMAQRGISVGEFFPQTQDATGGFTRERFSDETSQGAARDRYTSDYDLGFQAAWELDFWGRFRRQIEASDANLEASVADFDTVMVSLVAEVASNYVLLRTLEERLASANLNAEYQRRSYELAQARWEAGGTTGLDLDFSTAILRETEAAVPSFESQIAQAKYRLALLLGRPPSELSELLGETATIPQVPDAIAVGIPGDLLRRRPDVRSAERAAAAQSARVGIAEADFYPAISVVGSIGRVAESSNDLRDGGSTAGSFRPGFSWPLFNYGRIKNNVRVQDAVYQELIVNYRNTVLQAANEVENGLVGFIKGQSVVRLQGESAAAANSAVQVALEQYQQGAMDYGVVLLALEFAVDAMDQLAQDRGDVAQSLIATYRALGGGWELPVPLIPEETEAELRARDADWGDLLSPDYEDGSDLGFSRPPLRPAEDVHP